MMTNDKIYFVANWKMFGLLNSVDRINKVINLSKKRTFKNIKIVYCPPITILSTFANKIKNKNIKLGAQIFIILKILAHILAMGTLK